MPGSPLLPRFRMDVRISTSGPSSFGVALLWTAAVSTGLVLFALTHVSGPRSVGAAELESGVARPSPRRADPTRAALGPAVLDVEAREALARRPAAGGIVVDPSVGPLAGIELAVGGEVVTSDARGEFRLGGLTDWPRVDVRSRDYTLMASDGGDVTVTGGRTPLVVLLAPRASFAVRVTDSRGTPLEGVVVSVALDDSERTALRRRVSTTTEEARLAVSGPDGVATFGALWAGRNLSIGLLVDGQQVACDARTGDRLCLDGVGPRAHAIVLSPGRNAGLEAVLGAGPRVAGRVVDERGRPVSGVRVEIADRGRPEGADEPLKVLTSDAQGRFGGVVRAAHLFGPLSVGVDPCRDPVSGALSRLGYREPSGRALVPLGARVDAAIDDPRLTDLELRLVPHLPISGVLRGHSGASGTRIWAVEKGEPTWPPRHEGLVEEDGAFVLHVPEGVLDVLVHDQERGAEDAVRFEGIRAGTHGIELELEGSEPVTVHVRVAGLERPIGALLVRRFLPAASDDELPVAEAETRVVPGAVTGDLAGEVVDTVVGFGSLDGPLPLRSGCFALGVHVASADGALRFAPLVGGPLRFEGGEYVVTFDPRPAGVLSGRVTGVRPGERWAVGLADEEGRPVPLWPALSFHPLTTIQGVSAAGDFLLPTVPAGPVRLRLGSPEQLARGAYTIERRLEVDPGENPLVELALR